MGGQVMMSSCPSWGERQLRRELRASQSSFVFVRATEGELFAPSLFSLRLGGRRSPIAHCEGIIRCLGEDGLASGRRDGWLGCMRRRRRRWHAATWMDDVCIMQPGSSSSSTTMQVNQPGIHTRAYCAAQCMYGAGTKHGVLTLCELLREEGRGGSHREGSQGDAVTPSGCRPQAAGADADADARTR